MKRALRRLDSFRQDLLQTIEPLDAQVFSRRPSENEWSVAEIVQHLALVEARVTKELESAVGKDPQRVGFLRRLIPTYIVSVRLVRVKAPKAMNPVAAVEKNEAIESIERTRSGLKQLCETHGAGRLRNVVFKHPFLGDISGLATISFLGYHEQRHLKQIREVLQKVGTVKPSVS